MDSRYHYTSNMTAEEDQRSKDTASSENEPRDLLGFTWKDHEKRLHKEYANDPDALARQLTRQKKTFDRHLVPVPAAAERKKEVKRVRDALRPELREWWDKTMKNEAS
jgi:hypothetical protein